jgi:molecular chaperone GrpE
MRQGYKLGDQVLRHALVGVVDTVPGDGEQTNATVGAADNAPDAEPGDNADTPGD